MVDVRGMQKENGEWVKRNFSETWIDGDPRDPVLGMAEEVGELSHAVLKKRQLIRGTPEEHDEAAKDAIGDVFVYAMDVCNRMGWDLEDIMRDTWEKVVRKRDWVAHRVESRGVK